MAFVNIVELHSELVLVGTAESDLASQVFKGKIDPDTGLMDMGKRVSRKSDFLKPIQKLLESDQGWTLPVIPAEEKKLVDEEEHGKLVLKCGYAARRHCTHHSTLSLQRSTRPRRFSPPARAF